MNPRRWLCGTPEDHCTGGQTQLDIAGGVYTARIHGTPQDAFACHCRYLEAVGYKRVGKREFAEPGGGPVHVLPKPSHFGTMLRKGKHELPTSSTRWRPMRADGTMVMEVE